MQKTAQKRHNFTKISDQDLEMGYKSKAILSPLLFFKVLRTLEMMKHSPYPHGIKSFRKLLQKLERQEFIGVVSESKFAEQFIYPKEKLLRHYWGERWRQYFVHGEDVDTVKLHWQIAKIYRTFSSQKSYMRSESYINNSGPHFDFCFQRFGVDRVMSYGLYGYFANEENETSYFQNLREKFYEGRICTPIIVTRDWNEELQRELLRHYFGDSHLLKKIAFCHIERSFETKKQLSSTTLMTVDSTFTLEQYIMGEAERIETELEQPKTSPEQAPETQEISLWQSIKEALQ